MCVIGGTIFSTAWESPRLTKQISQSVYRHSDGDLICSGESREVCMEGGDPTPGRKMQKFLL